jgi:hypothetical protein
MIGNSQGETEIPLGKNTATGYAFTVARSSAANRYPVGALHPGELHPISMDETPFTVVGVLAAGMRDRGASVTIPLVLTAGQRLSYQQ